MKRFTHNSPPRSWRRVAGRWLQSSWFLATAALTGAVGLALDWCMHGTNGGRFAKTSASSNDADGLYLFTKQSTVSLEDHSNA